ncbi:hypothetical protein JCM21531_4649 [Acetivibrio straminisolvens JCM 21531]|uniref:Uncharacterized protein n=1 Tax=Acetivibrio straminisolvens JCM 21531 TaxID=1294263 RepID=W4VCT3_9FIRM|nr:hypothetical protein JCM21531_4649 [Acetivibrio straminisolvens JCM 21531]
MFAEIPYGISNRFEYQGSLFRDPEEFKKSIGHKRIEAFSRSLILSSYLYT